MRFTLIVSSSPLTNSYSALNFAQALLRQNHALIGVHFLFDGSYTANRQINLPSDEPNLSKAWSELAQQYNVGLVLCSASALRRGITAAMLPSGFKLGSIGQMVQSCDISDRVVCL